MIMGRPGENDLAAVRQQLSAELYELFEQMSLAEQEHAIRVWSAVKESGLNNSSLETAALLHDVGKIQYRLSLPGRVVIVLGHRLFPNQAKAWGQGKPSGWRSVFVVAARHAAWGADQVASLGADPLTVKLIREHQTENPEDFDGEGLSLLRVLQQADNLN
jgi:hypothetical protein